MPKTKIKKTATKTKTKKATLKKVKSVKPASKKIAVKKAKVTTAKNSKKTTAGSSVDQQQLINFTKQDLIGQFAQRSGDTGSPEVQVAIATQKIYKLTGHLGENPKDNHSRRGLLKIIAKRRRLLNYLQNKDDGRYQNLITHLGLKK